MMISEKMTGALNGQITNELNASSAYRAMAFEFEDMGLKIFGKRFHAQADEEHDHAMKIAKYVQVTGGKVRFGAVDQARFDYGSAQTMVEAALESEQTVTRQINELVDLAANESDHATRSFLQWYVDEQVEEESAMTELLQIVKMAGEANLFLAEHRLEKMMSAGG